MKWFRCYTDILSDDRLGLLAFEDRWHFIAVLAMKASGLLDDERTDLRERRINRNLGLTGVEAENVKKRLREVGLIDDDWQPVAWERRQYKHDDSRERVAAYRERQRQKEDVTACNGDVTATVTSSDTDTDTDISINNRGGRKRARFVPPTIEEVADYVRQHGYQVDPERFVNHYASVGWRVGKSPMKSWHHAVAGWHSRESSQRAPPGRGLRGRSIQEDLTDKGWAR